MHAHTSVSSEISLFDGKEGPSVLSQTAPFTPVSVSSSFRDAGDHIPRRGSSSEERPSDVVLTEHTAPRRPLRPATRASSRDSSAEIFLRRSRSSLEGDLSRYTEHGPVFDSAYRSISSCSFGREKRKICEHDRKQKMEKPVQAVIRHDIVQKAKPKLHTTFSRAKLGHWSQKPELLDSRWSQQIQRGHHSPPGSPHERAAITNRTAYGNQTMHDFFE